MFNKLESIVCLSTNISSLNDWDREHFGGLLSRLTSGKVYIVYNTDDIDQDIMIEDDMGNNIWIPYYMFESLDFNRNRKLESIGI